MERDWLRIFTGILALGFGGYCIILGLLLWTSTNGDSALFTVICLIYGVIYLIYGSSLLFSKKRDKLNFLAFAFIFGTFWMSGLPWYVWPMIIMPIIILVLTVIIVYRQIKKLM